VDETFVIAQNDEGFYGLSVGGERSLTSVIGLSQAASRLPVFSIVSTRDNFVPTDRKTGTS